MSEERCCYCGVLGADKKIEESLELEGLPNRRHPLTQYLCSSCFTLLMKGKLGEERRRLRKITEARRKCLEFDIERWGG